MRRRQFIKFLTAGSSLITSSTVPYFAYPAERFHRVFEADIIIYGGTSAAITAAVQAKKMGKSVIVVSPDQHLGGMTSGGLGYTDTGNKTVIGGLSREFYHRLYLYYAQPEAWTWQKKEEYGNKGQGTPAVDGENRTMWIFEPHAAERVFEDFVAENKIDVFRNEWLERIQGLKMKGGKILSFTTLNGNQFRGKIFIDATYEGDLMAASGVGYAVGREASFMYQEKWAGVVKNVFHHGHYFKSKIDPYRIQGDPSSGLLPRISAMNPGVNGEADRRIQAYCYRMCLSNHPDNRIPFPKPDGYDPHQYELLVRVFKSGWRELFDKFDPIPNRKTDTNNHGPFSTDNIGMNYAYPEGSYLVRRQIAEEHKNYQQGLMYFLATDSRIPRDVQDEFNTWGLAKDEFTDNHHWPHQLYVREARRMTGEMIMTEHEILGMKPVVDSVGMGSYTLDSHNVQRYVDNDGFVQNEGDFGVHVSEPYRISYRSLVPKEIECTNLLVPVCLSSSHVAYGSIRMEPVFMILGESAATAAAMAIEHKSGVQKVNYHELRKLLEEQGQQLG